MPLLVFHGAVLPMGVSLSITTPTCSWKDGENGDVLEIRPVIINSVVRIEVTVETFRRDDIFRILKRAIDFTQVAVDLVAFSTGRGLILLVESVETPSGEHLIIDAHDENLATLCRSFSPATIQKILPLIAVESKLWSILRDVIGAITHFNKADVNCARAIDGLKHFIAGPDATPKQSWESMRSALNVSEEYLKLITDTSKENRHGKAKYITGEALTESTRRTWVVVDRFFEWLIAGKMPLPLEQFPKL